MSSGTEQGTGQGRFLDSSKEKPVKVGEELDVTISEVSRRGDGVARVQGFVIFIPNTKQGTQAKIRIKEIRPSFATAELVDGGSGA
ncbi:MAG: TRAM domain-containing protein [Nitrososphaerota archaeon]|nr:TRAM domain-containing protein [Nitrososphaerota archaeon]MDG6967650.1 TRAM domain-containing protein [Nitrososphaerota archaeon]MDG6979386.1 TRAM domain-containing protein [Nitrososphaerota archaeon]MDG7005745.1 TRAM domain-containing protein [Nitrososphaerota archaeon]